MASNRNSSGQLRKALRFLLLVGTVLVTTSGLVLEGRPAEAAAHTENCDTDGDRILDGVIVFGKCLPTRYNDSHASSAVNGNRSGSVVEHSYT